MTHAAVWLDHREAKIVGLASASVEATDVSVPQHVHRHHPHGDSGAKEHPDDEKVFFQALAKALQGYLHILVLGPANAKTDFKRYAHEHDRGLEGRIEGVETVDHPTDGQIAALGRKFFKLADE